VTPPATAALLVTIAALFSYLNYRFVHLPGMMYMMAGRQRERRSHVSHLKSNLKGHAA